MIVVDGSVTVDDERTRIADCCVENLTAYIIYVRMAAFIATAGWEALASVPIISRNKRLLKRFLCGSLFRCASRKSLQNVGYYTQRCRIHTLRCTPGWRRTPAPEYAEIEKK